MAIQTALDSISQNQGSPFGFKNRIINGGMVIDQRNAGANSTSTNVFTVDRWGYQGTQSTKGTWGQNLGSVTPPVGFTNYLGFQSSSAYSVVSGDYFSFYQGIEGLNVGDLGWGTTNAQTVTLSFWARSSLTGTHGGAIRNAAGNYAYPFTYTISATNTWEQKFITISGPTTGSFVTTNACSFYLFFNLGCGTTYAGTAGSWSANNYVAASSSVSVVGTNAATFYVTGVQLEKGKQFTSFDWRPYTTELDMCQRYYYRLTRVDSTSGSWDSFAHGQSWSNTASSFTFYLPKVMRSSPSISTSAGTDFGFHSPGAAYTTTTGVGAYSLSNYVIQLNASLSSSVGTTVLPGFLTAKSGASAWIDFSTEI